jgi:hypothetical protein
MTGTRTRCEARLLNVAGNGCDGAERVAKMCPRMQHESSCEMCQVKAREGLACVA